MLGVGRRPRAALENGVVTGLLAGVEEPAVADPRQGVDPVEGDGRLGEHLRPGVVAPEVGHLVEEDGLASIGGPRVRRGGQDDGLTAVSPRDGYVEAVGPQQSDGGRKAREAARSFGEDGPLLVYLGGRRPDEAVGGEERAQPAQRNQDGPERPGPYDPGHGRRPSRGRRTGDVEVGEGSRLGPEAGTLCDEPFHLGLEPGHFCLKAGHLGFERSHVGSDVGDVGGVYWGAGGGERDDAGREGRCRGQRRGGGRRHRDGVRRPRGGQHRDVPPGPHGLEHGEQEETTEGGGPDAVSC